MTKIKLRDLVKDKFYFITNTNHDKVGSNDMIGQYLYSASGGFTYYQLKEFGDDICDILWVHKTNKFDDYVFYELSEEEELLLVVLPNL
jgi:hypothetical protein